MTKFKSQDDQEQFEEKVKLIADEELKRIKQEQFYKGFWERVHFLKNNKQFHPLINSRQINDYDYQMDVDTELSLTKPE